MIKRPSWILLFILALFIGVYFYLQSHPSQESTPTPTASADNFLVSKDNGALTQIRIVDAEGTAFQMGRDTTGNWAITQPELAAVDQSQAEAAETQLFALSVLTTLETYPSPDVIGLNPPSYTISLELSGDRQLVLEVGGLTPTSSGYYVQLKGKVYVVSKYSIDAVVKLLQNPPYLATPTPIPVMVATATTTETPIPAVATP